jgi:hypothetical protein
VILMVDMNQMYIHWHQMYIYSMRNERD